MILAELQVYVFVVYLVVCCVCARARAVVKGTKTTSDKKELQLMKLILQI